MGKILKREYGYRFLLVIGGLLLAVVICELGLRAFYAVKERDDKYYVWPPRLLKVCRPTPGAMPGVKGPTRFEVNSEGIRGDEISPGHQYRILAIGGSTTECLFLDQQRSWPYALQQRLNSRGRLRVWVGNAGKSGLSTREHYMHVKYLLPQLPKMDAVIILAGINDLTRRLIEDKKYDPFFLDHYDYWKLRLIRGAFSETPYYTGKYRFRTGYYNESAIGSLVVRLKDIHSKREMVQDESGQIFVHFRSLRREAAEIVNDLPDLAAGLAEYERNLNAIIDLARARSVRLIFMTQPTLYKPQMTQEEKNLLWYGWIESMKTKRYYSEQALREGMRLYNERLLRVCRSRGVECLDLAAQMPKSARFLYDDVHFNDAGSLMAAEALFKYLKQSEPFS